MNLDFLQSSSVRSALAVGGGTFLVSALISTVAGAGFLTILGRALLSGLLMGGLTAGLIEVLRKLVPEVMELFEPKGPVSSPESDETLFTQDSSEDDLSSGISIDEAGGGSSVEDIRIDENEISRKKSAKPRKKAAKEGDIVAEGVALENNPELMAEAVKHILDTDKDET